MSWFENCFEKEKKIFGFYLKFLMWAISYVFGPPGSGSVYQRCGSGSFPFLRGADPDPSLFS
jgi:hypothetical protein